MKKALFALFVIAEICAFAAFIDEFGALWAVAEVVLSAFVGVGLIISQPRAMQRDFMAALSRGGSLWGLFGRGIFRLLGGILLVIPGILSDIFGLGFLILSLFLGARGGEDSRSFQKNNGGNGGESGDGSEIIDVEVVEEKRGR